MDWHSITSVALTLFLIMDPLGNAPFFNAVLAGLEPRRRMAVMLRELSIALLVLAAFLFVGNSLLGFLGLSEPALNIAGGILLLIISVKMIFPDLERGGESVDNEDPFIVPLAVPLIAGPSTIAVLLLLSSQQPERLTEWGIALILAWLATASLLVLSPRLIGLIGDKGSRALVRLMGMILVIIATQMLLNGIRQFASSL